MMENTEVTPPGDVGSTGRDASPQDVTDDGYNSSGDPPRPVVTPSDSPRPRHCRPRPVLPTRIGSDQQESP